MPVNEQLMSASVSHYYNAIKVLPSGALFLLVNRIAQVAAAHLF